MQLSSDLFKALTGCVNVGTSGKRASGRVEMKKDVFLFPIEGTRTKPAELAEVVDVSRSGAAVVISHSPDLRVGGKLALRLLTEDGSAVLIHCEICRTYPIDRDRCKLGVRFLRVLKDCRTDVAA